MPAGKTNDVMINVPAAGGTALPVFDRELSLSGNAIGRDTGMLAYIGANGAGLPAAVAIGAATATPDLYNSLVAGQTFTVSDPSKGVIANDINVTVLTLMPRPYRTRHSEPQRERHLHLCSHWDCYFRFLWILR